MATSVAPTTSVTLDKRKPKIDDKRTPPLAFLTFFLEKGSILLFSDYLFIIYCYLAIGEYLKQNSVKRVKITNPYTVSEFPGVKSPGAA